MKKTFIRMLLVMAISWGTVWGYSAKAQFTDLKAKPAKDQSHKVQVWFDHWWLWFFY